MAIDIRATVTCSLGTLISGSVSDDYLQGSGLVKTKGSCEIDGLITPAVGTVVTFSYVKGGVTRSIPRKLRVLSSFADPFRRTTKVELGCKLTYLSDLKDRVKWDAFDDPENDEATEVDASIVTLPIYAASIAGECLANLGISASGLVLTNKFSIPEFDFSAGYVQVLSDLLVSESYFGYLDTNEVLQVRNLAVDAGTGPVFTSADIVDLGPIGVGQLPGEAVTVSYSTLKLAPNEACEPEDEEKAKLNWELEETIGFPESITVQYQPKDSTDTFYRTWNYIPRSVTITSYDEWDRVTKKVTTDYYIGAAINTQYYVDTQKVGATFIGYFEDSGQETQSTEIIEYALPVIGEKPESGYEEVAKNTVIKSEPQMAIAGAIAGSFINEEGDGIVNYMPLFGSYIAEQIVTTFDNQEKTVSGVSVPVTKTTTTKQLAYGRTQSGQQETARQLEAGATVSTSVFNAMKLVSLGTSVTTSTGRSVGLQERPPQADRTNAALNKDGDPSNGWRTESKSELELAMGSPAAQRRIEFSLPYAPDDSFIKTSSDPLCYSSIASDAPVKANRYGRVQNRLLLGNRSGVNLQVAPEKLPVAPFAPLYLQANGLTALYRANGNQWAFDSNGIVCSTDALFWAAVGGTGTFWFPVAPGITTLPAEPAIVDGEMNATTIVLPYNETAIYQGRLRLGNVVTKFEYDLAPLTPIPALTFRTRILVSKVIVAESAAYTLSGQAATFSTNSVLNTVAGSFSLVGQDAAFVQTGPPTLVAAAAAFTLTGQSAALQAPLRILTGTQAPLLGAGGATDSTGWTTLQDYDNFDEAVTVGSWPFTFTLNSSGRTSCFVWPNAYIAFDSIGTITAYSASVPNVRKIFFGVDLENTSQRVYRKFDTASDGSSVVRIRYEGTAGFDGVIGSPTIVVELAFYQPRAGSSEQWVEVRVGNHNRTSGLFMIASQSTNYASSTISANSSWVFVGNSSGTSWTLTSNRYVG